MGVGVRFTPQPHHYPDNTIAALNQQRGDGRTIYAAAQRDHDGLVVTHAYYLPYFPRNFRTTSATAFTAYSTSASVFPRPSVSRSVPRATSGA